MNDSTGVQTHRCFDIGGSKIVAADVSLSGVVSEIARVQSPVNDFNRFCDSIFTLCPDDDIPVSISIAGVIHPETGNVTSANIPCISGRNLSRELSACLKRDTFVINDANAFALAEAGFGLANSHDNVLAVILGTGIGGGIVMNGQCLTGANGTAGEWGHSAASAMRTAVDLPKWACNCGQSACIDTLGGARGLERLYKHFGSTVTEPMDSHSIVNAWLGQDALAMHVIDVWLDVVGSALASAVNLLDCSIVAVGGGLANSQSLVEALDKEVRDRCLASFTAPLLYRTSAGPEQGLLGAAMNARQQQPS